MTKISALVVIQLNQRCCVNWPKSTILVHTELLSCICCPVIHDGELRPVVAADSVFVTNEVRCSLQTSIKEMAATKDKKFYAQVQTFPFFRRREKT